MFQIKGALIGYINLKQLKSELKSFGKYRALTKNWNLNEINRIRRLAGITCLTLAEACTNTNTLTYTKNTYSHRIVWYEFV